MDKNNYLIHYRNLQQCSELGLKLKKIHRILQFKQDDWMKPYIYFNTKKEQNQLMNLIRTFLNWWITLCMAKQWKIWERE